jgi:hypothetical protein
LDLVSWAGEESRARLEPLGNRWLHTQGVTDAAVRIRDSVPPDDAELLVAAAYLHDVGYSPELEGTGFHPIDGARWLRGLGHERLAALVAHHSAARFEARARGLAAELADFPDEASVVSDALAYCDLTTGPTGQQVTIDERLDEIVSRYGGESLVGQALIEASDTLRAMAERARARLRT